MDSSIETRIDFASELSPRSEIFYIPSNVDGISEISRVLDQYSDVKSVHIFSHGQSGQVKLGATVVTEEILLGRQNEIALWSDSLVHGSDLLLYGCEVASGRGKSLVNILSVLTNSDVAASTNVTAGAHNKGDWDLEYRTGPIESDLPFDLATLDASEIILALPPDFTNELVLSGLSEPIAMAVLPSGEMLIAQRGGSILLTDPSATTPVVSTFLTIPSVDSAGEKGVLNIALDPDFTNNQYIYVYYHSLSADRPRISRFTQVGNQASPASEFIIWEDSVPSSNQVIADHWGGAFGFGPDGHLYLAIGDKKDFPTEAQDLSLVAGKIIRLSTVGAQLSNLQWVQGLDNPSLIPDDNPFIDGPGGNLDEIWAIGVRNPFRGGWDLPSGKFYIGEVGGNVQSGPDASHEDIHAVTLADAGANLGWPSCEGPNCTGPEPVNYSAPIFSLQHGSAAAGIPQAIILGPVYRGNQFPTDYDGALFYTDVVRTGIRYITFDAAGNVSSNVPEGGFLFADNGELDFPVAMTLGADGALYYATLNPGLIGRIVYNAANAPPIISQASADAVLSATAPFDVVFTGVASDPEGDQLNYNWQFGDGTESSGAVVTHQYQSAGEFSAVLRVSDGLRTTASAPIQIIIGSSPIVSISEPLEGLQFTAGQSITLKGIATDSDSVLSNESYTWSIGFKHNTHFHPVETNVVGTSCLPAGSSCFVLEIPQSGHDFSDDTGYEITLTATDENGLTGSSSVLVVPAKVDISFTSNVPGDVTFTLDELPRSIPFTHDTLIGFNHTINAPSSIISGGDIYVFDSWSNGPISNSQVLTVPVVDTTVSAFYVNSGSIDRVVDGMQALYTFEAGSGSTVFDVSGVGTPLNLTIENTASTAWATGTLSVTGSTEISSSGGANKINDAIKSNNELTLEAWITPANLTQTGPARIVSLSASPTNRNVTLGQGGSGGIAGTVYDVRLRTTTAGTNGNLPSLTSPTGTVQTGLTHVVYTRDATGAAIIYQNGVAIKTGTIGGNLSTWDGSYGLVLANEQSGDRPWLGTFDLLAFYDRALSPAEVTQNFDAGASIEVGPPIDEPPVAVNDTATVVDGGEITINVLGNDTANGTLIPGSMVFGGATNGEVSEVQGAVLYVHDGTGAGTDTFTYTVDNDAGLTSNTATVTVTINDVDDENTNPEANDDAFSTPENATVSGNVLSDSGGGEDTDADGDQLSVIAVNGNAAGVDTEITLVSGALLTLSSTGALSYDPNGQFSSLQAGAQATDNFNYTIGDGNAGTSTATVTLTITGVDDINTAPIANDDFFTTSEETTVTGNVLLDNGGGADTDADLDLLSIITVNDDPAAVGSEIELLSGALLTLSTNGALVYDPNGQYESLNTGEQLTDSFTYTLSDGNSSSAIATVTITINGVDEPSGGDRVLAGLLALYTFEEGVGSTVRDVSGVGSALNLTIETPGNTTWSNGTLAITTSTRIVSSGAATKINTAVEANNALTLEAWIAPSNTTQTGPSRIVSLSPNPFNRNVTLGQGKSGGTPGTLYDVRLRTSTAGNNGNLPSLSSAAGTASTAMTHVVYTRDATGAATIYKDGVAIQTGTIGGNLSSWDDSYGLVLANEQSGDRPWLGAFDLVAFYDRALSAAEVTQNYNAGSDVEPPIDEPPVAVNDTATVVDGGEITINVLGNDTANGTLIPGSMVFGGATNGEVSEVQGAVLYVHDGTGAGTDTFTYTVDNDAGLTSNTATVTVTVTAMDAPPVANPDSVTLLEGGEITIDVLDNDNAPAGFNLSSVIATDPSHGSLILDTSTGELNYSHFNDGPGTDSFTYSFSDTLGVPSNDATVSIIIDPVSSQPVANDDTAVVVDGGDVDINVLQNDTPLSELDPTSVSALSTAVGTVTVNPQTGMVNYDHDGSGLGTDSFTYTVSDNIGQISESATVFVTINPATGDGERVTDGIQALYTFDDGNGLSVADVSGVGAPLNLSIDDSTNVSWGSGSLTVLQPAVIASAAAASKISDSVSDSNAVTLEAWVAPSNLTQTGPARIAGISQSPFSRNLTLGQGGSGGVAGNRINVRLRSSATDLNGVSSAVTSTAGTLTTAMTHVVFTRTATGVATIYVDGDSIMSGSVTGNLSNWASTYGLVLANEQSGDRPWLGTFDLVAFYDRALNAQEVLQNFAAGSDSGDLN